MMGQKEVLTESPLQRSYGTDSILAPVRRRRLNLRAVFMNLIVPWLIFLVIFGMVSFTIHYRQPKLVTLAVAICYALCLGAAFLAFRAKYRDIDMMWYSYSALSIFIATTLALLFGELNYRQNMQPYYDMSNLRVYEGINPAEKKGRELMDAGQIYFTDDTELDIGKAIGFKNKHMYCVAPISFGDNQLASYDFWAIGVDCCSGAVGSFQCGEYDNIHAHAGLRLMEDDKRDYYKLAVQMAESASNVRSEHPLFFYWIQDPGVEMDSYSSDGFKYCMLSGICYFFFSLFWVCASTCGYLRIGPYNYGILY